VFSVIGFRFSAVFAAEPPLPKKAEEEAVIKKARVKLKGERVII